MGRSLLDHELDRISLIKGAEEYLGQLAFGSYFNGHKCMLRALCETAAASLYIFPIITCIFFAFVPSRPAEIELFQVYKNFFLAGIW